MSEQPFDIPHPENATGAIVLEGQANFKGRVKGYLTFGELAGQVEVDLSRLEDGDQVLVRHRGVASYVFTEPEYLALSTLLAAVMLEAPERTQLFLRDALGEARADRLLEKLQLSDVTTPPNEAPARADTPSER